MQVNGASLTYVDDGQGAPVVFVHGSLADHRTWERQRAIVGKQYRVIAYSQRYFNTEPSPRPAIRGLATIHRRSARPCSIF